MDWREQYEQAMKQAGFAQLDDWSVLRLTGPDRADFLQNFCTNDVKRLEPGTACEAFVTNVKGKIFAHILAIHGGEQLVVISAGGPGPQLRDFLDRYHIREDLTIELCPTVTCTTVFGPHATELLAGIAVETAASPATESFLPLPGGCAIQRDWFGAGSWLLQCDASSSTALFARLEQEGAVKCNSDVAEALRIETGTPQFARDFGDDNFPQEVSRDELAISFTKGCYLGQETVARIDALGHVNRQLCRVAAECLRHGRGAVRPHCRRKAGRASHVVDPFTRPRYGCGIGHDPPRSLRLRYQPDRA